MRLKRLAGLGLLLAMFAATMASSQTPGIATSQSPHGNLNVPCQNCHTAQGWKPIRAVPEFDHNQTKYPLRGMHVGVACTSCHVKPVFSNVGNKCQDCHADIHKRQLGANCEQCHTVRGWGVSIQQIQDHNNRFPLTGAHAAVDCDACHKNAGNSKFQTMSTNCLSCHQTDFKKTTNPNHVAGGAAFLAPCESCHSTDNWLNAKFDHAATGFLLTGGHASPPVPCAHCHINNNYNLGATPCVTCHMAQFTGAKNPDHVAGNFPQTCESCHTAAGWSPATFDHASVNFPLTGGHTVPPRTCTDCHINNNYQLTSTACVTCHLLNFQNAKNPDHVVGGFAQTCEVCHNTSAWQPATFDHSKTAFPLTGAHQDPPRVCADCHINNNYNITVTTCISCHQTAFDGATTPVPHAGFPTTCENCHDTVLWTDGKFDHTTTGFPLTGLHTDPPRVCTDCHVNNNYSITTTTCVSCHLANFQGAKNPDHVAGGFAQTCEICHSTSGWSPATFDHSKSGFPLTGSHTVPPRACADCHINNNYQITVTTCISCHQAAFNGATTPVPHTGFPTTCQQCHDTVLWTDAKFDHTTTGFPLTGTHATTACALCHINNNYNITSTTCVSCHQTDYNNAKSPVSHVGFPVTCEQCHDTVLWTDATFDHSTTGFPLTGTHLTTACALCHVNNNYNITVTTCVSCHQTDYNGATTPVPHIGFPTTCQQCHDTVVWADGKFDHTTTGFPLTGTHATTACALCHINNNYNITQTTCVSCHQTDYNNAKSPVDHAGFPTTCQQCHDTVVWTNGKFDHTTTGWPLTGTHLTTPCVQCHVNNNYNITVTACVSCHLAAYTGAKTPVDHTAFPTTCEGCHDTVVWTDGKFDHSTTGFPLVGTHLTTACALCHINNNYNITVTTCISCHQAAFNGATTPVPHTGFPTTCELCHDTVLWTDATFNHNNTPFPLTGFHTTVPCASCHVNNNYTTLPLTCIGCHQATYNATVNPGHAAQPTFFPSAQCSTCHTTAGWLPATFVHTQYTRFPISHGNANGVCLTCHTNSNDYSIFQCTQCHGGNNSNNFSHPQVNGYVYNSVNCYQCHNGG